MKLKRRVPIDFKELAARTGLRRGKVCYSKEFGWCVQDPPVIATIEPPPMQDGETLLRIKSNHWEFLAP